MSVALNFSVDSEFTDKTSSSVIVNDLSRTTGKSLTDSTVIVTFAALLEPFALVILYENFYFSYRFFFYYYHLYLINFTNFN